MTVSLSGVRELLSRQADGILTSEEHTRLVQDAKILRRRLERLKSRFPELAGGISLRRELDELAQPQVLSP